MEHKTLKVKELPNGNRIIFDRKVVNQDVYACPMTRGHYNEVTGETLDGDPNQEGFAFLFREDSKLHWSHSPTGQHEML